MRIRSVLATHVPGIIAAALVLPWVIAGGSAWPWAPNTIDLDVYQLTARDLLAGRSIYDTRTPGWDLPFIYPPIAALLAVPMAFGERLFWQIVWGVLQVVCLVVVARRLGLPANWRTGALVAAMVVGLEPIRTTIGYGQVNIILMTLVVADLLPPSDQGRRRLPRGLLVGLAAAIKLTPLFFIGALLMAGRWRTVRNALLSFGGLNLFGLVLLPRDTVRFFTGVTGETTPDSLYVGNQSLVGAGLRLLELRPLGMGVGLAVSVLVAVAGLLVFVGLWRGSGPIRQDRALAVALAGLTTCLVSPVSWTHHYVWAMPLAIVAFGPRLESVPKLWLIGCRALVLLIAAGLPLALLPYAQGAELTYNWWQDTLGAAQPLLGAALLLGVAVPWTGPVLTDSWRSLQRLRHSRATAAPGRGPQSPASRGSSTAGQELTRRPAGRKLRPCSSSFS